jgi:hypothetical protein
VELANLVTEHLGDIIRVARAGIDRIRRTRTVPARSSPVAG